MKLEIITPKGSHFSGEVEYGVIDGDNGQIALLENHSPIVVGISEGFIKKVVGEDEYYYFLSEGIVEYNDNIVNIIAQEIEEGATLDEAKSAFQKMREAQRNENKRKLMDFTELEKELAKQEKDIEAKKAKLKELKGE